MAKILKVLPALLLAISLLLTAGCFGGEIVVPESVDGSQASDDTPDAEKTDEPAPELVQGEDAEDAKPVTEETASAEITVEEAVLFEAEGVKITVTGYEDGWMGPEIKMLIENASERNVIVMAAAVSVNGYMMPMASLYADVAAGMNAYESLMIMSSQLDQSGIDTVAQLQFYLDIQDADTWDSLAKSDLITLSTSAAGFEQPVDDTGDVLYEGDGIRVICKGLKQDIVWDGTVVFYMENNCGQPVTVYAENVAVNGFMQDAGMWSELRDGTRIVDGLSLLDLSDLELTGIDEVETISFSLRIINSENWNEIAVTDMLTLNFG
ncbi:MAG: hypothetical protein IJC35_03455 [Oscillospiraceae bacterium]|nr:hypothetical protein [Oscillospiraceae bacterium]